MIKAFAEWLNEQLGIPNAEDGDGRTRESMPQIVDHDAFVEALKSEGIETRDRNYPAFELTPTQGEFNEEKVLDLLASGAWKSLPIVVSCDHFVIDGHHRWAAAAQKNSRINCFEVNLKKDNLLLWLRNKPFVRCKDLDGAPK